MDILAHFIVGSLILMILYRCKTPTTTALIILASLALAKECVDTTQGMGRHISALILERKIFLESLKDIFFSLVPWVLLKK